MHTTTKALGSHTLAHRDTYTHSDLLLQLTYHTSRYRGSTNQQLCHALIVLISPEPYRIDSIVCYQEISTYSTDTIHCNLAKKSSLNDFN